MADGVSDQVTPEAASQERAALMADAGFRERAAAGGAEWQRLSDLNRMIAGADDDGDDGPAPQSAGTPHAPDDEDAPPPGYFDPPPTAAGYDLPTHQARELGLQIDPQAEMELRQGLHAAGVDAVLAQSLYQAAMTAHSQGDLSEVGRQGDYLTTERDLRKTWGSAFEANLAAANAEALRVFEALPASVTGGADFATYCRASGLGNNGAVIKALLQRARARG